LALCIHQLQTSSVTDETLEQDQKQLRDQSLGKIYGKITGIPENPLWIWENGETYTGKYENTMHIPSYF